MRVGSAKVVARAAALALTVAAGGCSHLSAPHWPWHPRPAPASAPVHELDISGTSAAAFTQSWIRNTLLIDMSAASGSGAITLRPVAGSDWPVRLALRVTPGAFGVLEVRAAQRVTLPVTSAGGKPIDLELTPGVYTPATPQISVSWGPLAAPVP